MIKECKVTARGGKEISVFTLENVKGSTVAVTNYGATIMEIVVPDRDGKKADVVLGYKSMDGYMDNRPFLGVTVGRYANRIANGRFTLNGKEYVLECNENPFSHLHGGNAGFDKKVWNSKVEGDKLLFTYVSADGEEGYPGELTANVTMSWSDEDELTLDYKAGTDKDTIVNLTNHSYFNLNGAETDILGHELLLNAPYYTPIDEHLIPTGETAPTNGTPFDFTEPHKIGERITSDHPQMLLGHGYDHNFVIEGTGMRFFGSVYCESSGRMLEVFSDQPAVQFYTSNFLGDLNGKRDYHNRWGVCLETQNFPDAINHENFPSCVLKTGEIYRTATKFRFSVRH
jgi:aldose 1-epimerase